MSRQVQKNGQNLGAGIDVRERVSHGARISAAICACAFRFYKFWFGAVRGLAHQFALERPLPHAQIDVRIRVPHGTEIYGALR